MDAVKERERGSVLVATAIIAMLAMAVWAIAFRATLDSIRVERFFVNRHERDSSVTRALAAATGLLQTGHPPTDPYSCIVTVVDGEVTYDCTVSYTKVGNPDTWFIESRPSTESELATLPPAPSTF